MFIYQDFCLKPFTTFGVAVEANRYVAITSVKDLQELYAEGELSKKPVMVLGGGSNILFTQHYEGFILACQILGKEILKETEDEIIIRVGGGEHWPSFVDEMVEKGYGGIENLSLIPGKVGAAPIQNIGAYGVEVKEVFENLDAFELKTGKTRKFNKSECEFGYRSSIFKTTEKGKFFITHVTFRLSKKPKLNLSYAPLKEAFAGRSVDDIFIKEVSEAVIQIRNSKLPDPEKLKNAGSFFKNPVVSEKKVDELKYLNPDMPVYPQPGGQAKLAAGWLIEQCGWKGKRKGDAGVHEKQALVIVNYGNATGKEILALANDIQKSVQQQFGIKLEPEVNII
ncbi:MAG: UDP-N-acetylmuramate dehydrogenase [Bacteroidetes bacterium]|nr:UDP-N-acetylmuramate dehydrogenase [Bacteroidota bacterium]